MAERQVTVRITTLADSKIGDPFKQMASQAQAAERQSASATKSIQQQITSISQTAKANDSFKLMQQSVQTLAQTIGQKIGNEAVKSVQQLSRSYQDLSKSIDGAARSTTQYSTASSASVSAAGRRGGGAGGGGPRVIGTFTEVANLIGGTGGDIGFAKRATLDDIRGYFSGQGAYGERKEKAVSNQELVESKGLVGLTLRAAQDFRKSYTGRDQGILESTEDYQRRQQEQQQQEKQSAEQTKAAEEKAKLESTAMQAFAQEAGSLESRQRAGSVLDLRHFRETQRIYGEGAAGSEEGFLVGQERSREQEKLVFLEKTFKDLQGKGLEDSRLAVSVLEQQKSVAERMISIEEKSIEVTKRANQERIDGLNKQKGLLDEQANKWEQIAAQQRQGVASAQVRFGMLSVDEQQHVLESARSVSEATRLESVDPEQLQAVSGFRELFGEQVDKLAVGAAGRGGFAELVQLSGKDEAIRAAEQRAREAHESRINIEKNIKVQLEQDPRAIADLFIERFGPLLQKVTVSDESIRLIEERIQRQQNIQNANRGTLTE